MKMIIAPLFALLIAETRAKSHLVRVVATSGMASADSLEKENAHSMYRQLFGDENLVTGFQSMGTTGTGFQSMGTSGMSLSMITSTPPNPSRNGSTQGTDTGTVGGNTPEIASVRTSTASHASVGAPAGVIATVSLLAAAALVVLGLVAYRRRTGGYVSGASSVGTELTSAV
jgi:hypothetical protein